MDQSEKASLFSTLSRKVFTRFFGTTQEVQRARVNAVLAFMMLVSLETSSTALIKSAETIRDAEFAANIVFYYHLVIYVVILRMVLWSSKSMRKRIEQMSLNRAWYVMSDVPFGYYVNIVGENRPRHQGRQIPQPIKPGMYTVTLTQHGGNSIYVPMIVSAGECIQIVILDTMQIEIRRSI